MKITDYTCKGHTITEISTAEEAAEFLASIPGAVMVTETEEGRLELVEMRDPLPKQADVMYPLAGG